MQALSQMLKGVNVTCYFMQMWGANICYCNFDGNDCNNKYKNRQPMVNGHLAKKQMELPPFIPLRQNNRNAKTFGMTFLYKIYQSHLTKISSLLKPRQSLHNTANDLVAHSKPLVTCNTARCVLHSRSLCDQAACGHTGSTHGPQLTMADKAVFA